MSWARSRSSRHVGPRARRRRRPPGAARPRGAREAARCASWRRRVHRHALAVVVDLERAGDVEAALDEAAGAAIEARYGLMPHGTAALIAAGLRGIAPRSRPVGRPPPLPP